jgi:hypothetical protein
MTTIEDIQPPYANPLHRAVGEAIEAYSHVEATMASLLQDILKLDVLQAHAVLFAIQNTRSRNEMFETLLEQQFTPAIRKYWASCSNYLLKLGQFRNAIAHWHPHISIYVKSKTDLRPVRYVHALGHPAIKSAYKGLEAPDFPPFLKDCQYIREELSALILLVKERPQALPEKFRQPLPRRNQAVLQPRQKPKAQQPQRPPSQASGLHRGRKPSARQRRERAMARAKKGP